jgi:Sensors of blue-light using FAD
VRLIQLVYASRPFGFDDSILNGILSSARRNNRRDGITGALVCRADLFLQMLEGPRDLVTAAFGRILKDDRHMEIACIHAGDLENRLFPAWDMLDDPARSWMWSQAEVAKGAVQAAPADEIRAIFTRIAAEPRSVV